MKAARALSVGLCHALLACSPESGTGPRVVIDGNFAEWDSIPPVLTDPLENGIGAVDFGELRIESDDDAVYLAIDLVRAVTLQAMYGTIQIVLDADGDSATGFTFQSVPGADRVIELSPRRTDGRIGQGMATRLTSDTTWQDVYGIGLMQAPTHAARYKELRIARTGEDGAVFPGATFRGRLLYLDANGEVADETDIFEAPLREPDGRSASLAGAESVQRAGGTTFRLLAWNVADRGPLDATAEFAAILSALSPDVVLFDEVSPTIDASWFSSLFVRLPGDWTVVRGSAGGRQTSVVASTLPLDAVADLSKIEYPDSIFALIGQPSTPQLQRDLASGLTDGIPTVGAALDAGGQRLLLLPVDLQCCGHAASSEERARVIVADAIRAAVRAVLDRGGIDGVVIAGDFNLVGSRDPLDTAGRGIDPAGGDLVAAAALRLDGVSDATWGDPGPFPPGRLDFVLHSAALRVLHAFPFSTADLSNTALTELGLERPFSAAVSDHLPVVVDFAVSGKPSS